MGKIYEQKSLVKLSRTLPTMNKAPRQAKGIDSVFPLSSISIQKKPVPISEDQTGVGSLYKDDTCSESEPLTFVKIDENVFLLEDDIIIIWNGEKYIKSDGNDFNLTSYSKPQEKTLAIGMSEYGSLLNTDSRYTYMQTTNANPCIILILRSKNETEMYHITVKNDDWRNNILSFISRQGGEHVDDIDKVKDNYITENEIKAYLYQGKYEEQYQKLINDYEKLSINDQVDFTINQNEHGKEHIEQYKKWKDITDYLTEGGIPFDEDKQENVRINLISGNVDFPMDQDVNKDLGVMIVIRGKTKGDTSTELMRRESNIEENDNYQEINQYFQR